MGFFGMGESKPDIDELENANERAKAELSYKQTQLQIQEINSRLKQHGLTLKSFGGSVQAAIKWLKDH
jgi:hypothetical protein